MPQLNNCPQIRESLQAIQQLKGEFDAALEEVIRSGDTQQALELRAALEERMRKICELLNPFHEVFDQLRTFYQKHNLPEFKNAIPEHPVLSVEAIKCIYEALQEGYDCAWVMPAGELHQPNIQTIRTECADTEVQGLSVDDQYTKSYVYQPEVTLQATTQNRSKDKPYLILYKSSGVEPETRGKTFPQCEEIFRQKNEQYARDGKQMRMTGFSLAEYFLLQRYECEKNNNHHWDGYSLTTNQSQWLWLLDSQTPSGCMRAGWQSNRRRVIVTLDDTRSSLVGLGARSAVIIPLER